MKTSLLKLKQPEVEKGMGRTVEVVVVEEEGVVGPPEEEENRRRRGRRCRPIGFLLSLPFALCALILSAAAAIVWIQGSIITYLCPGLACCANLANSAMEILMLPIRICQWFVDSIPF